MYYIQESEHKQLYLVVYVSSSFYWFTLNTLTNHLSKQAFAVSWALC